MDVEGPHGCRLFESFCLVSTWSLTVFWGLFESMRLQQDFVILAPNSEKKTKILWSLVVF